MYWSNSIPVRHSTIVVLTDLAELKEMARALILSSQKTTCLGGNLTSKQNITGKVIAGALVTLKNTY